VRAIGNDLHMDYSAIGQTRTWRPAWNSSRLREHSLTAATLRWRSGGSRLPP